LAVVGVPSRTLATTGFEFHPPHRASRSRAVLEPKLAARLRDVSGAAPREVSALIQGVLEQTGRLLYFGLDHAISFRFGEGEREGHCVEYSHLFARLFDDGARARGLRAQAFPVHSDRARLFGMRVPRRGFDDHDWVLVVERDTRGRESARHFVDPTFYDMGLSWNIEPNVRGRVGLDRI
jgi:hypothetical protein